MSLVIILISLLLVLSGCASAPPRFINLMPAPDVYSDNGINPFADTSHIADSPYWGMLYATDRAPADEETTDDPDEKFYSNERGLLVRLGLANIQLGKKNFTWEQARQVSLAKNRPDKYPLKVIDVEEFGVLDSSFNPFVDEELLTLNSPEPAQRFATLINDKLAISKQKDIFIYVHGYMVVFENPILVASELWHYLGYEGVFVAYSWPSTPNRWAYLSDSETTNVAAYHFRTFLEYLAENTQVERIHIIGYSQGTRLVAKALYSMALLNGSLSRNEALEKARIGNVILVGSDIERQSMGIAISDGLLNVVESLTIYVSEKDKAMGVSKFLFGRERVGQMFASGKMKPNVAGFLRKRPELIGINVTEAEGATSGVGHAYFRSSPWASSDILMMLRYNLSPAERGLVRSDDNPVWSFPPDYISRLREAIVKVNPELAERLKKQEVTGNERNNDDEK